MEVMKKDCLGVLGKGHGDAFQVEKGVVHGEAPDFGCQIPFGSGSSPVQFVIRSCEISNVEMVFFQRPWLGRHEKTDQLKITFQPASVLIVLRAEASLIFQEHLQPVIQLPELIRMEHQLNPGLRIVSTAE